MCNDRLQIGPLKAFSSMLFANWLLHAGGSYWYGQRGRCRDIEPVRFTILSSRSLDNAEQPSKQACSCKVAENEQELSGHHCKCTCACAQMTTGTVIYLLSKLVCTTIFAWDACYPRVCSVLSCMQLRCNFALPWFGGCLESPTCCWK